nr:efflux RND transporter periplasmic adaptor subunit [uncultured Rhodopila sp.]
MNTPAEPAAAPPRRSTKRRWLLLAAAIGFLGLGGAYAVWWDRVGRVEVDTDNAYVAGNVIQVTPQVSGTIVAIHADDTDFVQTGRTLIEIDDADARLALEQAKAELAQTVREVATLFSMDGALNAVVSAREATLARAEQDLARRQKLASSGAVSAEELKHASDTLQEVQAQLAGARSQAEANRVLIDNTTIADHPRVLRAASKVRDAWLALRRCSVPAPVSGQVARRSAQLGQRTTPGVALMTIVPLEQVWVDANFKEAQLREVRIGQPAELTADIYGGGVVYHGRVVGLAAGTGGAFSLLPAQNATGNWLKVVQRVPVRIALDPAEVKAHPLRIGLSMQVAVRVEDQSGKLLSIGRQRDTATTSVFEDLDHDAAPLIARIIADNTAAAPQAGHTAAAR